MMKQNVFAIDGLSASGKGTLAKKIASYFNLPYLNTGLLYRLVGYELNKINFTNFDNLEVLEKELKKIDFSNENLNNPILTTEEVGQTASIIAKIQLVRTFLLEFQKDFANQDGGAVLDGRDIGTTICPDAQYKFYIVANPEVRAERRYKEMVNIGIKTDYNVILNDIKKRDYNDLNRPNSPLKRADDAIEIDTSFMTKDECFEQVLKYVNK